MNDLTPHDTFFCAAFADPRHAASLIRSAMARDPAYAALIPHIAWDQLRRVEATVVDAADRSFRVDLLFEAPFVTADGTVIPILFTPIFEHKSFLDRLTAWQSLRYQVRTIDWQRGQPGRHNSWPIVITIVVYHGGVPWTAPRDMRDLFVLPDSIPSDARHAIRSLLPSSRYLLHDLSDCSEEHGDDTHLSLVAFLAIQALKDMARADAERLRAWLQQHRRHILRLLGTTADRAFYGALLWYLMNTTKVEPEVLKQTLYTVLPDNDHEEWLSPFQRMLREQRAEGLAEGKAEGKAEGSRAALASALLQLLARRFGPIHDSTRLHIQSADTNQLEGWFAKAIDAKSIDDALAD